MNGSGLIADICRFADAQGADHRPCMTGVEGLSIVRARAPTHFEPGLYDPLLCVVLQGRKESFFGADQVRFGAGEALIVSLDLPTSSRVTEATAAAPYVALALQIDIGVIRGLSDELELLGQGQGQAMESGAADEALVDAMGRLFALTHTPGDVPVMRPLLVREVHYRLLQARHGGMLRSLARRDSHASRIHRVLAHIRKDCTAAFSVPDLAAMAGMSGSSFHDHFKAVTATTPLQYIKEMRLLEARRLLTEGEPVTGVAFAVGYESPTQFSREYSRKFGLPPSEDRAAA